MQGFLNLHKPLGLTSHDCVAKVRRLLRLKRVGHGGTLDPAASGVLPIALGKATRLLQYLRTDKSYRATVRLGVQTTTDDLEGEILHQQPGSHLTLEAVQSALSTFQGVIQQVPPQYSAVHVEGQRLYDLARAGQTVAVAARPVEIFRIDVLAWRPGEFPELEVEIACGPGTYIRAIARDLGMTLGTGGTLAALTRTQSCGLNLSESLTLEELAAQLESGTFQPISIEIALAHLPVLNLSEELSKRWCHGQRIPQERDPLQPEQGFQRVYDPQGQFLGITLREQDSEGALLRPQLVLTGED